jgi:hypothetical protein
VYTKGAHYIQRIKALKNDITTKYISTEDSSKRTPEDGYFYQLMRLPRPSGKKEKWIINPAQDDPEDFPLDHEEDDEVTSFQRWNQVINEMHTKVSQFELYLGHMDNLIKQMGKMSYSKALIPSLAAAGAGAMNIWGKADAVKRANAGEAPYVTADGKARLLPPGASPEELEKLLSEHEHGKSWDWRLKSFGAAFAAFAILQTAGIGLKRWWKGEKLNGFPQC